MRLVDVLVDKPLRTDEIKQIICNYLNCKSKDVLIHSTVNDLADSPTALVNAIAWRIKGDFPLHIDDEMNTSC